MKVDLSLKRSDIPLFRLPDSFTTVILISPQLNSSSTSSTSSASWKTSESSVSKFLNCWFFSYTFFSIQEHNFEGWSTLFSWAFAGKSLHIKENGPSFSMEFPAMWKARSIIVVISRLIRQGRCDLVCYWEE